MFYIYKFCNGFILLLLKVHVWCYNRFSLVIWRFLYEVFMFIYYNFYTCYVLLLFNRVKKG